MRPERPFDAEPTMRSTLLVAACLALGLAGCRTVADNLPTGSIGGSTTTTATTEEGWRQVAAEWGPRYDKDPSDARAATAYGRALRQLGQRSQAVAVLQTAAAKNPNFQPLLGEYGRALAESGNLAQALDVLSRAHTPDKPDWRILSAQGAVLDQMGRNAEARQTYLTALKIVPDEPSILSNLGLSYALSNDLANADQVLRKAYASASADERVRQNFALVLALEGKFDEAQKVAGRDLTAQEAAQNIATIRGMVAQSNNWKKLKTLDARPDQQG
jgi:Flp pilus assembly protein TadD